MIFWNLYQRIMEEEGMIDTKKEQERDELHRAIWAIAEELRGAVDGWDFKNYVLGTMFYRYISENLCNYVNSGEIEAGNTDFDFAKMADENAEESSWCVKKMAKGSGLLRSLQSRFLVSCMFFVTQNVNLCLVHCVV